LQRIAEIFSVSNDMLYSLHWKTHAVFPLI